MGAYLYFKLARKNQADEYNKFIAETEEGKRLINAHALLTVSGNDDIEWAKNEYPQFIRCHQENFGKGDFKASGIPQSEIENSGCKTEQEYFELITNLFIKAQTKFKMWFASRSCAFSLDGSCFSIDQMKRITQNGKRLKCSLSDPEKYEKLLELLK